MNSSSTKPDYRDRLEALRPEQRHYLSQQLRCRLNLDDGNLGGKLTAVIQARRGSIVDSDELKRSARLQLPDYMIPQQFVVVESIQHTAAGKIDRAALSLSNWHTVDEPGAESTAYVAPGNETEQTLCDIWKGVLGVDELGVDDDFFEIGGDSLLSIRILARANKAGLRISPEDFFDKPTVAQQARLVEPAAIDVAQPIDELTECGLSPIQHWFFENFIVYREQWNQSLRLQVSQPLNFLSVQTALHELIVHHAILRVSFIEKNGAWRQVVREPPTVAPLAHVDLRACSFEEVETRLANEADALNRSLDLQRGSLMQMCYASAPAGMHDQLLVVIHHLVIDAESWRNVLADLDTLSLSAATGQKAELPGRSDSFIRWSSRLNDHANTANLSEEFSYWQNIIESAPACIPADLPSPPDSNTHASVDVVTVSLEPAETEALVTSVTRNWGCELRDALLAALVSVVCKTTGLSDMRLDVEGHGREFLFDDLDISRSIGWFTTVFPVMLSAPLANDPQNGEGQLLLAVKESIRSIPQNGIGYGVLRYLRDRTAATPALRPREPGSILFNYLGNLDKLESRAGCLTVLSDQYGEARHPNSRRAYQIEINSRIESGRLQLDMAYSSSLHHRSTIEAAATLAREYLCNLSDAPSVDGSGLFTPTDFPLADLDQKELDTIAGLLSEVDED